MPRAPSPSLIGSAKAPWWDVHPFPLSTNRSIIISPELPDTKFTPVLSGRGPRACLVLWFSGSFLAAFFPGHRSPPPSAVLIDRGLRFLYCFFARSSAALVRDTMTISSAGAPASRAIISLVVSLLLLVLRTLLAPPPRLGSGNAACAQAYYNTSSTTEEAPTAPIALDHA